MGAGDGCRDAAGVDPSGRVGWSRESFRLDPGEKGAGFPGKGRLPPTLVAGRRRRPNGAVDGKATPRRRWQTEEIRGPISLWQSLPESCPGPKRLALFLGRMGSRPG